MSQISRRRVLQSLGAVGVVGVAGVGVAQEPDQPPAEQKPALRRVAKILAVTHQVQTSQPPNLLITAVGEVPTGGWSDVVLLRRIYVAEPADGIYEYDLLAKPPDGPATQAFTQVKAANLWEKIDPAKVKGIRVFGVDEGIKVVMFGKKKEG